MTGYETDGRGDLLACAGGAAAVLARLIFVGLSVNMSTLLELDKQRGQNFLTGRALEAFAATLTVLVIRVVALTPRVVRRVLAAFILRLAAGCWLLAAGGWQRFLPLPGGARPQSGKWECSCFLSAVQNIL